MDTTPTSTVTRVIEPESGWKMLDFKELKQYRDLFYYMVWRDIKVMYAQTVMGLSWAILQPLIQIVLFTIIFGKVAKIDTQGIPYILFSSVAIIPWTYISKTTTQSSMSLVSGANMLGKIYFPRIIFPFTPVLARLIDFFISLLVLAPIMIYYKVVPSAAIIFYFLFFSLLMMVFSAGIGTLMSSMAIRYRDVKYAMGFALRMLMYTAPIVYSAAAIPETYRLIYCLNPLVGIIEGFRASLLGLPLPWQFIWPGIVTNILLLICSMLYFRKMERVFVDVI